MNIKVAAFTVSEKSINTNYYKGRCAVFHCTKSVIRAYKNENCFSSTRNQMHVEIVMELNF